jgi:hypothetical protein
VPKGKAIAQERAQLRLFPLRTIALQSLFLSGHRRADSARKRGREFFHRRKKEAILALKRNYN